MSEPHDQRGNVPGPQQHAEGQHGEKTHAAFIDNLHTRLNDDDQPAAAARSNDVDEFGQPKPGRHRLNEDREQHDLAEKDSEIKHHGG